MEEFAKREFELSGEYGELFRERVLNIISKVSKECSGFALQLVSEKIKNRGYLCFGKTFREENKEDIVVKIYEDLIGMTNEELDVTVRLLNLQPLSNITEEDWEVSDIDDNYMFNKRHFGVFKIVGEEEVRSLNPLLYFVFNNGDVIKMDDEITDENGRKWSTKGVIIKDVLNMPLLDIRVKEDKIVSSEDMNRIFKYYTLKKVS